MLEHTAILRTNYFHVKDEKTFKNFMSTAPDFRYWEGKDEDGGAVFAFGLPGDIYGMDEEDLLSYEEFVDKLKEYVAGGDAIIISELGGEERDTYITSYAKVITSNRIEYIDIIECAACKAREMLGNKDYSINM